MEPSAVHRSMRTAQEHLLRLSTALEGEERLDVAARGLKRLTARLREEPIRSLLSGTGVGHALHPMLVDVPIGCWSSAIALDLLGGRGSRASRRLIGIGVLAALPAVASGLCDWSDTEEAEMRVGLVHGSLNSVATALFALSWWRRRGRARGGWAWSLAGAVVASGAGWLGGHLAYSLGVGVDTNAFEAGPQDWTDAVGIVGPEGSVGRLDAPGARLVSVHTQDGLFALADRCSHRGGPLSEGRYDAASRCIVCPWHGSNFRVETGAPEIGPAAIPQPVYEIRSEAVRVQVRRRETRALRKRPVRPIERKALPG